MISMVKFCKTVLPGHKVTKMILTILLVFLSVVVYSSSGKINAGENFQISTGYGTNDRSVKNELESDGEKAGRKDVPKEAIVVIDPGHGGSDLGTCYGSMYEKNINLDISERMGEILKKAGIKVVFTRESDVFVGLQERAAMANDIGASLFVSVHTNEMPGDSSYNGTETLFSMPDAREADKMDGERLATIVQRELVKSLKTADNGIIYRPNLAVLHRTKMPAVIAEIAYLSNYSDRQKLTSGNFKQRTADALSNAVLKALNEIGASKKEDGKWLVMADK